MSVSEIFKLISENPSVVKNVPAPILFKFQYFCGDEKTLNWFKNNLNDTAKLEAVTNAEKIKLSPVDQMAYLIRENFLFEAVKVFKKARPDISPLELGRFINLPKVAVPTYEPETYVDMLCARWNVAREQRVELQWNDFPSNDEEDSNVCVPYRIVVEEYFLRETVVLLESLGAWYGRSFNTLPFDEFIGRLTLFIRHTIDLFSKETVNSNMEAMTKELSKLLSEMLQSPEKTIKDVINAIAFLVDEKDANDNGSSLELNLNLSLIEYYRKLLDSHISLCPTVFGMFLVTKLLMSGDFVMNEVSSDKALATLSVWAARKVWSRSATFNDRHPIRELGRLKNMLPVFVKGRFSLNSLLRIPPLELVKLFKQMEALMPNIPQHVLVNYIPWIFIDNNAFSSQDVPKEYATMASIIHVRSAMMNCQNEMGNNGRKYPTTNPHKIVQTFINLLAIRNLVEPFELMQLSNNLIDFCT